MVLDYYKTKFPSYYNHSNKLKIIERISYHLNYQEVKCLIRFAGKRIEESQKDQINDGKDFFIALFRNTSWDETNHGCICHYLKYIRRYDLLHMVTLPRKRQICEEESNSSTLVPQPVIKKLRRSPRHHKSSLDPFTTTSLQTKEKITCNVRLRVQAEYLDNMEALKTSNLTSDRQDPLARKFDLMNRAFEFLRNRELGIIICDVTFSEVAHLDAFWTDYIGGNLINALKDVFLTDRLREAVGNQNIKLMVSVNEEDYKKGRAILFQNTPAT